MKYTVRASALKKLVDNTKKFTRDSYSNKLMKYIYLEIDAEKKEIKATAVNGWAISIEKDLCVEADQSFTCYIKANIPKVTKKDLYADIELAGDCCYITVGDSIVGFVQPECEYFKLDNILNGCKNTEPLASVSIRKDLLSMAVQSLKNDSKNYVDIEIREGAQPVVFKSDTKCKRYVLPMR